MAGKVIFGITGQKYNGKDTVGSYLIENKNFKKFSFAEPIKDVSKLLFGFNDEQVNGKEKETIDVKWNVTPRTIMQFIGTEMFRKMMPQVIPNIGEDFWVTLTMNKVNEYKNNVVITDVRFDNEIAAIRKNGGKIIRVVRPGIKSTSTHESEINILNLKVDYEVINDGTIEELYQKISKIM
jgi:hypothetical protein